MWGGMRNLGRKPIAGKELRMMLRYIRVLGILALAAAVTITPVAPAFGQQMGQQTQQQGQQTTQQQSQGQTQPPPPTDQRKVSDEAPREYSKGKIPVPNLLAPYSSVNIPMPNLSNSARLQQFIRDGKLYLSLQDCLALALENNLDIAVQKYLPWIADTTILSALAGNGVLSFDPKVTATSNISHSVQPVSNPFLTGAGTGLSSVTSHSDTANFTYNQGFSPGTNFSVFMNNTHSSSSSKAFTFNPSVQSSLTVQVQQALLNGFGILPNTKFILIARNNRQISDLQFQQLVITTITNVQNDYWNYVFAIQSIVAAQESLTLAQQLYDNNKKQAEIGTMAPLDVTTAKAQVASATTAVIQAQTARRQSEVVLLSVITKNPLSGGLSNLEIVPTDNTFIPNVVEDIPLDQAVREALTNRPDYKQFQITLNSDDINIRASRNALLPTLNVTGQYGWTSLAGHQTITSGGAVIPGLFVANLNSPIVNAGGTPTPNQFVGIPATTPIVQTTQITGLTDAFNQIGTNQFPSYLLGFNLTIPIRNRAAQATNIAAILQQREDTTNLQRQQNLIVVDVHQAQIQLDQARATLNSAISAKGLQEESLAAELKKLNLGASTQFQVIQIQNSLAFALNSEVQARVALVEAKVNFDRALGRTLQVNNIQISEVGISSPLRDTLIPGTKSNGDLVADNPNH
jgi:outer membrane protein TolC